MDFLQVRLAQRLAQSFICFLCLILMFFYSSLKYLDMFSLLTSRRGLCNSKSNRPSVPEKWLLVRVSKTIFSGCSSSTWRWKENWEQKGESTINKHKSNSRKIFSCICSGSWRLARPGSRFHLSHQTLRGRFLKKIFLIFTDHWSWSVINPHLQIGLAPTAACSGNPLALTCK